MVNIVEGFALSCSRRRHDPFSTLPFFFAPVLGEGVPFPHFWVDGGMVPLPLAGFFLFRLLRLWRKHCTKRSFLVEPL